MAFLRRWVFWTLFFTIGAGVFIHLQFDVPWLSHWLGKLPGDMYLTRGRNVIYIPAASGAAIGFVLSFLLHRSKVKT